jgi:hypothetical protein
MWRLIFALLLLTSIEKSAAGQESALGYVSDIHTEGYVVITYENQIVAGQTVTIASNGRAEEFRIEKIIGKLASAIPRSGVLGSISVGSPVTASTMGFGTQYWQDARERMSPEQAERMLQKIAREVNSNCRNCGPAPIEAREDISKEGYKMSSLDSSILSALTSGGSLRSINNQINAALGESRLGLAPGTLNSLGGQQTGSIRATPDDDRALAQRISGTCEAQCAPLSNACKSQPNAQSACYRAAACTCECFLNQDTRPVTSIIRQLHAQWQQCVRDNRAAAQQLR